VEVGFDSMEARFFSRLAFEERFCDGDLNDVLFDIFTSNRDIANGKIFVIVWCP